MTGEKSADDARDHQNRKIPKDFRSSGDCDCCANLSDVVKDCADDT